jgi:metal-responsive CopG/Arc/MetJ family transcriptional regulator
MSTVISITLSKELKAKLDKHITLTKQTRSGYIAGLIAEALSEPDRNTIVSGKLFKAVAGIV